MYDTIIYFSLNFQEYSVQITFRQKWNDDRLSYDKRLGVGDMKREYINTSIKVQKIQKININVSMVR